MTQPARRFAPAPGSWPAIGLIFLYGVSSSASLSKVIPVLGDVGSHFGGGPGDMALLISLFGVLPALLASVAGSIIDRIGAHRALLLVALTGVAVNVAYLLTNSLHGFMVVRVAEGMLAVCAYSGGPALIMATTAPERRGRAMAMWSTYTPTGFSLGLLVGGAFAGGENWRGAYVAHLALFAVLAVAAWMLPRAPAGAHLRRVGGVFAAWGQSGPLRVALTFAVLVMIGFGMSSVYPDWYSRQHTVTVGAASSILAIFNLAMIPAGFIAGALLGRGWRDGRLFNGLVIATIVLCVPLFIPGVATGLRLPVLLAWMLVQGSMIAITTAALPRVVADPRQGAAAAGLLSQLAAAVTFATPLVWQPLLQHQLWKGFVAVTVVSAIAAWLLFPRRAVARD